MTYTVEQRIEVMRNIKPAGKGMCANTVWRSLDVPRLGTPSAAAVVAKVRKAGKLVVAPPSAAPRGSLGLWSGGSNGYGHIVVMLGGGKCLSTDVDGPATVGTADAAALTKRWGLKWEGYTTWYGVDLPMGTSFAFNSWTKVQDFYVPAGGNWITFAETELPPGVRCDIGMQIRIPKGHECEFRLARVGWGDKKDMTGGVDGTFYLWFSPRSTGSQGQTRWHSIHGGGPVAYQLRAVKAVTLPTLVAKAYESNK